MVERETTLTPRNKDRIEEHTLQESTGAQNRSTFVSEGSSLCPPWVATQAKPGAFAYASGLGVLFAMRLT